MTGCIRGAASDRDTALDYYEFHRQERNISPLHQVRKAWLCTGEPPLWYDMSVCNTQHLASVTTPKTASGCREDTSFSAKWYSIPNTRTTVTPEKEPDLRTLLERFVELALHPGELEAYDLNFFWWEIHYRTSGRVQSPLQTYETIYSCVV